MTTLYLIRHGEAVSNVEPVVGGMQGDTGLTFRGVAQAERLRDRLIASGEIAADALVASTLPRARQTAEILAPALDLPIVWDDEVQELRVGEGDGLNWHDFAERFGIPDFDREPARLMAPGGDSWITFMARVSRALDRLTREYAGKTVVVVCHGGVIDGSFLHFFGLDAVRRPPVEFYTRNTSITQWELGQRDGAPARWRLKRYNDVAHLDGAAGGPPRGWEDQAAMTVRGAAQPSVPLPTEE